MNLEKKRETELEIYIHIPFCVKKCNYCDFLSFPIGKAETPVPSLYVSSLIEEIKQTGAKLRQLEKNKENARPHSACPVRSVFFGGGTPSLLTGKQMAAILSAVRESFPLKKETEITTEANPGTLLEEKLFTYRQAGINRLSIGLQSADDSCLALLGRIHTYGQFLKNYELAKNIGFTNINIDLMSGLPGQSIEVFRQTLEEVTALRPQHISAYSLILEEETPFYTSEEIWRMLPDEETDRKMYSLTKEILKKNGYERYEISNYALPGKECLHNLGYWSGTPYLGFGLGAASCFGGARFSNEKNLPKYIETPYIPFPKRKDYAVQTKKDRMEEFMFLGLRRTAGVSDEEFKKCFGKSLREVYGKTIEKYEKMALLAWDGRHLRLTDAGIDVSDYIFCDFML